MRKGIVVLAIGGLVVGAGIGTGPITFRAGPAQLGTEIVLTANQSICDKYCDGRDPALASGDRQALGAAIYGRSIVLHFDDADDMAWASIDTGSAGDEVWMDRSWDGGYTWSGGSKLGDTTIPSGKTGWRTEMYNLDDWSVHPGWGWSAPAAKPATGARSHVLRGPGPRGTPRTAGAPRQPR